MSISAQLLPELEHELKITRTCLERIPDDKLSWKPHHKSMSMGELGSHLANILAWAPMTIDQDEFDVAPPAASPLRRRKANRSSGSSPSSTRTPQRRARRSKEPPKTPG